MGLAEPRKRIKLSHDPRNLAWSEAPDSFGARIMQGSGWKPGTALGASSIPVHESSAAKVKIAVKDDMLGLGASLKSKNVEHQRTGLDAFQGLLGRLNAKDETELHKVEQKIENKKLAMFAQGRWGGMVFVPGGLLVQEDPAKAKKEIEATSVIEAVDFGPSSPDEAIAKPEKKRKRADETAEERAQRKAEKKQRKEDRKSKKEAKMMQKLHKTSGTSTPLSGDVSMTDGINTGTSTPVSQSSSTSAAAKLAANPRMGRALLRGRNIQAKRAAFSDSKGLDQIFMRQQQQQQQSV